MNVEEMIEKIRQLSVVQSIGLLPVTFLGDELETIEIMGERIVLKFTDPYKFSKFAAEDLPENKDDRPDCDIDF